MKKIGMLLICVAMLAGCASFQASKAGATPEQQKAANCTDASLAVALSTSKITGEMLPEAAKKYWEAYRVGAELFLATYCGAK